MAKLGEVCEIVSGSTPKTGNEEYWNGSLCWITPAEISDDDIIIKDTNRKISEVGAKSCSLTLMPVGTVLLSSRAPIGKVAITGTERFVGYRFKHILKVEFDSDYERLGKILYALGNCDLNPEFRISYTVKDPEAAKNELLGKAVKDAKEKVAVITVAAGVTLKDIQSIDYSWGEIEFEVSPMNRLMKACAPAPTACEDACYDMDIEPDDIEVADTVTVIWEID